MNLSFPCLIWLHVCFRQEEKRVPHGGVARELGGVRGAALHPTLGCSVPGPSFLSQSLIPSPAFRPVTGQAAVLTCLDRGGRGRTPRGAGWCCWSAGCSWGWSRARCTCLCPRPAGAPSLWSHWESGGCVSALLPFRVAPQLNAGRRSADPPPPWDKRIRVLKSTREGMKRGTQLDGGQRPRPQQRPALVWGSAPVRAPGAPRQRAGGSTALRAAARGRAAAGLWGAVRGTG